MPERIAALDALDPAAARVGKLVRGVLGARPVKDVLGGSWLGHPVHPMFTDVTIGAFTSALVLDWLGGSDSRHGEIADGTVTCPWHDSVFALRDGALVHGPAAYPQPAWDVRVRSGRVEVRRR